MFDFPVSRSKVIHLSEILRLLGERIAAADATDLDFHANVPDTGLAFWLIDRLETSTGATYLYPLHSEELCSVVGYFTTAETLGRATQTGWTDEYYGRVSGEENETRRLSKVVTLMNVRQQIRSMRTLGQRCRP